VLADEPARGLGCEVDEEELEKGRHALEKGGQAPCPCVVEFKRVECGPSCTKGC
jgi:hypothetical protein